MGLISKISDKKKEQFLNGLLKAFPDNELDGLIEVIQKEKTRRGEKNDKNQQ
jgi:hypothetical protein